MDRRQLLKGAAGAAAAATLLGLPGPPAAAAASPGLYVYDTRSVGACALAASAASCGADPRPIAGDITRLWADELRPRWRRGDKVAVSGLTAQPALRCLELLAHGEGMAVTSVMRIGDGLFAWHIAPAGKQG